MMLQNITKRIIDMDQLQRTDFTLGCIYEAKPVKCYRCRLKPFLTPKSGRYNKSGFTGARDSE